jgi:hypothetical protein
MDQQFVHVWEPLPYFRYWRHSDAQITELPRLQQQWMCVTGAGQKEWRFVPTEFTDNEKA